MKKIMIAAAIALAAVGVQAASVDWLFSEVVRTDKTYTDLSGGTAYLFLASDWANVIATADGKTLTTDNFKGYLDSQSLTVTTATSSSYNVNTYGMAQKQVTNSKVAGEQSYYVVLTEGTADGSNIWVSDKITKNSYDEAAIPAATHTVASWSIGKAATSKFLTNGNAAYAFGSGGDTPEPTSAMLLLLGVAGLALRRKTK